MAEQAVAGRPLPHLPGGELPAELARIAMKALSLRLEDRHATVRALQAEVRAWIADSAEAAPSEAPPPRWNPLAVATDA